MALGRWDVAWTTCLSCPPKPLSTRQRVHCLWRPPQPYICIMHPTPYHHPLLGHTWAGGCTLLGCVLELGPAWPRGPSGLDGCSPFLRILRASNAACAGSFKPSILTKRSAAVFSTCATFVLAHASTGSASSRIVAHTLVLPSSLWPWVLRVGVPRMSAGHLGHPSVGPSLSTSSWPTCLALGGGGMGSVLDSWTASRGVAGCPPCPWLVSSGSGPSGGVPGVVSMAVAVICKFAVSFLVGGSSQHSRHCPRRRLWVALVWLESLMSRGLVVELWRDAGGLEECWIPSLPIR